MSSYGKVRSYVDYPHVQSMEGHPSGILPFGTVLSHRATPCHPDFWDFPWNQPSNARLGYPHVVWDDLFLTLVKFLIEVGLLPKSPLIHGLVLLRENLDTGNLRVFTMIYGKISVCPKQIFPFFPIQWISGWWFGTCFICPSIGNNHHPEVTKSYFSEG